MDKSKWEYKKLGEICTSLNAGGTPSRGNPTYWNGNIPWVKIKDMNSKYVSTTEEFITEEGLYNSSAKVFEPGTILYSIFATIGAAAILNIRATTNQAIAGIVLGDEQNRDFFYYYLTYLKSHFETISKGVAQNNINLSVLRNQMVFVPPISDQQRIVAELDCLNEMLALKQEQLKEFDKLAQSIFYDMFGDPITNEKGWSIVSWNEALQILNGRNQKMVETSDGKYPICGSAGVMGRANDYICPEDTVIIGRKGNINKPILMREKFWNVDTAFGLVPNREKLDSVYLFYFCDEYDFEKHNRAVTIPSLTKSDLLRITFPLPPLALQQQFAEKIQAIEAQKELVKKSIAETQQLLDSRMDYYFD